MKFPLIQMSEGKLHPTFKEGSYTMKKIQFVNWVNITNADGNVLCDGNFAIHANDENGDNQGMYTVKQLTFDNTPFNNTVKFYNPPERWLLYEEFNCRFETCLGPHNRIIRDLDGSILEGPGSIISNNTKAINTTANCKFVPSWRGYQCPNVVEN